MKRSLRQSTPMLYGSLGLVWALASSSLAFGQESRPQAVREQVQSELMGVRKSDIPDIFFPIPERERMLYPIPIQGPPSPLQRFQVHEFMLKATFVSEPPMAIVSDPEGNSYIVRLGEPMGPFGGRVTDISRGKIIVTERYLTYEKTIKVVRRELGMPKEGNPLTTRKNP